LIYPNPAKRKDETDGSGIGDCRKDQQHGDKRAGRIATAAAASLRDFSMTLEVKSLDEFNAELENAANLLLKTRPTAVSLSNAYAW